MSLPPPGRHLQLLGHQRLIPDHLFHRLRHQFLADLHLMLNFVDVLHTHEQLIKALHHTLPVRIPLLLRRIHRR